MRQHASTILTLLGLRAHAIEWGPFVGRQGIEMRSITSIDYAPVNSEPASIRVKKQRARGICCLTVGVWGRTKVAFWPALGKVPIKSSRETRLVYKDKDDVSPQGTMLKSLLRACSKQRERRRPLRSK